MPRRGDSSCRTGLGMTGGSGARWQASLHKTLADSIHPLRQVVAALECCGDLGRGHALVRGEVLGVLPLEELDSVLGVRLTPEVAICRRLLVLGLAERQRLRDGTRAAIELDLDHIRDVLRSERALPM